MTPETFKKYLLNHGIRPLKSLGQNFLYNDVTLTDIADAAQINSGDTVLEIGPGIGNLTNLLLNRAGFVLSVEKDASFIPMLRSLRKQHVNFRYEIADILRFNFSEALGGADQYVVVANIPYYITGKLIQLLLHAPKKPKQIVLLVQKEVAENITAQPGALSILGLSVQLYADAEKLFTVPAKDFFPEPKVDSAVIRLTVLKEPRFAISDDRKFFGLIKACFSGKRKQLHNSLASFLGGDKMRALKLLASVKINPALRPQELSLFEWVELFDQVALEKNNPPNSWINL